MGGMASSHNGKRHHTIQNSWVLDGVAYLCCLTRSLFQTRTTFAPEVPTRSRGRPSTSLHTFSLFQSLHGQSPARSQRFSLTSSLACIERKTVGTPLSTGGAQVV